MKKSVSALCIASLLSVMGAGVANAAHYAFTPPTHPAPPWAGVDYTFQGPTTLKKGILTLSCTSTFKVRVVETIHTTPPPPPRHGDNAQVVGAVFSGSNPLCGTVTAASLPWTVTPNSLTSITVAGVAVNTPIGNCTPSTLTAAWTNGPPASHSFSNQPLAPDCFVTGVLTQVGTPAVGIVLILP